MSKYAMLVFFAVACSHAYAAVRYVRGDAATNSKIVVSGEIRDGDYQKFKSSLREAYSRKELTGMYVVLDTPGGNVLEAMEIGRLVRLLRLTTTINRQCDSACLFVFIAGANRIGALSVGIHRPRFTRSQFAKLDAKNAQSAYDKLNRETRNYMRQMKAPNALIEKMFQTPSTEIHNLTVREAKAWIPPTPTALDEWLIARCGSYTKR